MRDLQELQRQLLASDYKTASDLYFQLRNSGTTPSLATGCVYRHGFLDGRDAERARGDEGFRKYSQTLQENRRLQAEIAELRGRVADPSEAEKTEGEPKDEQ